MNNGAEVSNNPPNMNCRRPKLSELKKVEDFVVEYLLKVRMVHTLWGAGKVVWKPCKVTRA